MNSTEDFCPFPSSPQSLFQSESERELFDTAISSKFQLYELRLIFMTKNLHNYTRLEILS